MSESLGHLCSSSTVDNSQMTKKNKVVLYVTAHIMNFCIGVCSATTPKNKSRDKLLCLSQGYLPLFAYTHAKFERVEALLKGQVCCLKAAL